MKFNFFLNRSLKGLFILGFLANSIPILGLGALSPDSTLAAPRVQILRADVILRDMVSPNIQRLVGGVSLRFKDVLLFCDSAWRYDDGRFKTMGQVRLQAEKNTLTADVMEVNPTLQSTVARSWEPKLVTMTGDLGESTSPVLRYDMEGKSVFYEQGGVLIQEGTYVEFQTGRWQEETAVWMLGGEVSIDDGSNRIVSDSLHILKSNERIVFFGKSVVRSQDSSLEMHCSRGVFSGETESGWFGGSGVSEVAWIRQENMILRGDSLVLPSDSFAPREAWGHVVLLDTTDNWILEGAYAKQLINPITDEVTASILAGDGTRRAMLMDASGKDTLFMQADTMIFNDDLIHAWPKIRMQQGDSKVSCDTLIWNELDSLIQLRHEPLLWLEGQFLRADSVTLTMIDNAIDRLHAWGHVGLMYPAGDSCYQQIAGRDLQGIFREGKLREMDVSGNAEIVYFDAEKEEAPCGEFNRSACSRLQIEIEDGTAKTITLLDRPSGMWTSWESTEASPRIESLIWTDPPASIHRVIRD